MRCEWSTPFTFDRRYNIDGLVMKIVTNDELKFAVRELLVAKRPLVTVPLTLPVSQTSNEEAKVMAQRNKGIVEIRVKGKAYYSVLKERNDLPEDELLVPTIHPFKNCSEAIVSEPVISRFIL